MRTFSPTWTDLCQLGVMLLSTLGGFLLPPPELLEASTQPWPTPFIVTVAGLLLVAGGRRWRRARDTRHWVVVAAATLGLALAALLAHRFLLETWSCRYYGAVRLIGSELTADAAEYLRESPLPSCEELLKTFTGRREEIWTRASLVRRELVLGLSYVCVLPLLAACAIATIQAVSCSRNARSR